MPDNTTIQPMIGYVYIPDQTADFNNIYSPEKGFERATIFPALDLPINVYGIKPAEMEAKNNG